MNTTGKKHGGRKKGTPNKVTTDLRTWINNVLDDNREQVIKDLKALKPNERLMFLEKLVKYIIPAKTSADVSLDVDSLNDEQVNKIVDKILKQ